ncbi:cytochrome c biogenesis protein DipZ [Mesorhizobium sp. CN2-181]|uniref:cytochrome c biogenesis protein DipZ n=1 Tax=Mesorhizobium yinganensis TaxID=3157707 RepID=UPI0032B7E494
MLLFLLAYLGGVLTIVSPCILPVLPFVFARADRPFLRSGLPMLIGMALTFALVASLAAVAGGWAVEANRWGRFAAILLLGFFGITLLFPSLSARLTQPLVDLGARLSLGADVATAKGKGGIWPSLLLGVATGLLWAPCAGPVLGLILTGAALNGANAGTTLLLAAFAAGAATSLALALLVGGKVFAAMKRSLGAGEWVRRGLGVAVLAAVVAIFLGLDTGFLTRVSLASTAALEQGLLDRLHPEDQAAMAAPSVVMDGGAAMSGGTAMMSGGPAMNGGPAMQKDAPAMNGGPAMMAGNPAMMAGNTAMTGTPAMTGAPAMTRAPAMTGGNAMMAGNSAMAGGQAMMANKPQGASDALPVEGVLPALNGAAEWLNSPPLSAEQLKGKVVLIDFWTYSCINCLRTIPYVKAWAEKYKDQGLVVIGVHTPEFAFEKDIGNVTKAAADLGVAYPVAVDNDYAIWRAFNNRYWPAHYFIDAQGRIRHHQFGEGGYDESERVIQALLAEAGNTAAAADLVKVSATGAQAASDMADVLSPETYLGYERAENFVSPGGAVQDAAHDYADGGPRLNEWGLSGKWTVGRENATLDASDGSIVYKFHARDLHLVLGSGPGGKPVRFRVTIDGAAPGDAHGMDIDADGQGTVTGQRLYQLVRQKGEVKDRTFEIKFLDPGVQAYAFTFG